MEIFLSLEYLRAPISSFEWGKPQVVAACVPKLLSFFSLIFFKMHSGSYR